MLLPENCRPTGSNLDRQQSSQLALNPYYTQNPFAARSMSEIAFHEKAGWSQGNSGFIVSFCSFSQRRVFLRRVATVAMLPSALSRSDSFARCTLGVLVSAGAAICLAPCGSALGEWNLGQAINA